MTYLLMVIIGGNIHGMPMADLETCKAAERAARMVAVAIEQPLDATSCQKIPAGDLS